MISLRGVGKRYVKYDDTPTLIGSLRLGHRTRRSAMWAVQDLDVDIAAGESVGVLGRNGAGKSTVLQLLAGVTAPTRGVVEVGGRVSPLLSVGVGFHPELTGRENVQVNGTVLGMSQAEIARRFDEIVDFAELEAFIDTPVKFYSSGMFVRLGFAVAVAAEPDVLLVDEVLAVGDFPFQLKCHARMAELRDRGTTVIAVSHNLNALRGTCSRALVLHRGRLTFDGSVFDAIGHYYRLLDQPVDSGGDDDMVGPPTDGALQVEAFDLVDELGRPTSHLSAGEECGVRLRVRAARDIARPFLGLTVAAESGVIVYTDTNFTEPMDDLAAGESAEWTVRLRAALPTGGYTVSTTAHRRVGDDSVLLARPQPLSFHVTGRRLVKGVADLGGEFPARTRP